MLRYCTKCEQNLPETCFSFKNKSLNKLSYSCKECHKTYSKKHYQDNKTYYKSKAGVSREIFNDKTQKYLIMWLLNHPCGNCGDTDIINLDFHHIDHKTKSYNVCSLIGYSFKKLKEEIEKCEVLCSKCHRFHTAKEQNSYRWRYLQGELKIGD